MVDGLILGDRLAALKGFHAKKPLTPI